MAILPALFPWNLGGDAVTGAGATEADETPRVAQYLKGKPNAEALLDSLGQNAADLALTLTDLELARALPVAGGAQLDVLGAIVGIERAGASDAEFRAQVQATILLNNSSGTAEEILAVFALIKPTGATIELREFFPAAINVFMNGVPVTDAMASLFAGFLRRLHAAGVRAFFQWSAYPLADTFTFDGTAAQALDVGHFAGRVV